MTLSIFSDVSGELGLLVIIEVDHEIEMFIATLEASAAFPLTHSSIVTRAGPVLVCLSSTVAVNLDKLLLVLCHQSDRAVDHRAMIIDVLEELIK